MDITKYLVGRVVRYIGSILGILIFYGVLTVGLQINMSGTVKNVFLAAALFAYPVARIIRMSYRAVADYLDEGKKSEENLFAWLCEETAPNLIAGSEDRIFLLNLLSLFVQLSFFSVLIYAFITGEPKLFVGLMIFLMLAVFLVALLFGRILLRSHRKKRDAEAAEISQAQELTGFPVDAMRRKAFLRLPKGLLLADGCLLLAGFLEISLMPMNVSTVVYYIGTVIRTLGILALLLLPFALWYFYREWCRSTRYVIEIGRGEYGQIKVECWQYEGTGDEREKVRNKIDRFEKMRVNGRYIRVLKMGNLWPVKIPRTMTIEREKELLDTLKVMETH